VEATCAFRLQGAYPFSLLKDKHRHSAAAGDVDGDGALDVFVPAYGLTGGPNIVWRNTRDD
jgi:hypothetical protein